MIVDYQKSVLTASENSEIDYPGLVHSLNTFEEFGFWILTDEDFVFQDNESIFEDEISFFKIYSSDKNEENSDSRLEVSNKFEYSLQTISERLSGFITTGSVTISTIGHEGHEYVWLSNVEIESTGRVVRTHFDYGPGIEQPGINSDSYNPD